MSTAKGSRLMNSAAWNVLSLLALGISTVVTAPILVSRLGAEGYGLYMLVLAVSGFAGMLDLGLGEATLRFVSRYLSRGETEGVNRVFGATMFVYACTSLLGGAGIILLAGHIAGWLCLEPAATALAGQMLMVGALAYMINTIASAFRAIPEAAQRYDILSIAKTLLCLCHAGALVAAALATQSARALVLCTLGYSLSNLLVFAFLARRVVPGLNLVPRPTRAGLREVFGYGVFSFINQLIARAGTHLDRLLLGMFFGPAQVAWLAVPKDLLLRASGVTSSIGRVLFPRFSRMRQDGHMCDLFLTSTWCLLVVSLTCFVPAVVLMPRFLELWMGRDFARHASGPAQVLAAAFALTGAFAPYFSLLKGTDRMHWLTGIFLTTTGLGIAASLVLVPWLGLWGAALRYWVAIWCGFVVIAIITRKVFGASLRRRLVPTLCVPILLSIGLGGAMVWATGLLGPLGWIALLGSWAGMSALLASALWGCNRLQTGRDGPAAQVADALRRLLPGRRASRVLHPDLPSTARKETAA